MVNRAHLQGGGKTTSMVVVRMSGEEVGQMVNVFLFEETVYYLRCLRRSAINEHVLSVAGHQDTIALSNIKKRYGKVSIYLRGLVYKKHIDADDKKC